LFNGRLNQYSISWTVFDAKTSFLHFQTYHGRLCDRERIKTAHHRDNCQGREEKYRYSVVMKY
jgi:hypothetical protein